jgi:hypothetical protein
MRGAALQINPNFTMAQDLALCRATPEDLEL